MNAVVSQRRKVQAPLVALVVPCYNEEEVLPVTLETLGETLGDMVREGLVDPRSFAVFIDDGSRDATWALIEQAAAAHAGRFRGVRLARNAGHQAALLAGLEYVQGRCDASVSLDADLQDDVAVIASMVRRFNDGAEMVLGVRNSRDTDTWFKRTTANGFYRMMRLLGVTIQENHADYRLMSAKAMANLERFSEANMFLRGIVPLLHGRVDLVHYARKSREAGTTKYPLGKMLALAWNGVTSFSTAPLRIIMYTGAVIFLVSLALAVYALWGALSGQSVPGWASIVVPLYVLGGLLMLSIGIVGEYLGKVFLEAKRRPRYFIDAVTHEEARHG
jgi:glycosyltransferase involved in cell wall biosynthesis